MDITFLPDEIIEYILILVDPDQLGKVFSLSKSFYGFSKSESFWRMRLMREYPFDYKKLNSSSSQKDNKCSDTQCLAPNFYQYRYKVLSFLGECTFLYELKCSKLYRLGITYDPILIDNLYSHFHKDDQKYINIMKGMLTVYKSIGNKQTFNFMYVLNKMCNLYHNDEHNIYVQTLELIVDEYELFYNCFSLNNSEEIHYLDVNLWAFAYSAINMKCINRLILASILSSQIKTLRFLFGEDKGLIPPHVEYMFNEKLRSIHHDLDHNEWVNIAVSTGGLRILKYLMSKIKEWGYLGTLNYHELMRKSKDPKISIFLYNNVRKSISRTLIQMLT